jgi:hypothetical protein
MIRIKSPCVYVVLTWAEFPDGTVVWDYSGARAGRHLADVDLHNRDECMAGSEGVCVLWVQPKPDAVGIVDVLGWGAASSRLSWAKVWGAVKELDVAQVEEIARRWVTRNQSGPAAQNVGG